MGVYDLAGQKGWMWHSDCVFSCKWSCRIVFLLCLACVRHSLGLSISSHDQNLLVFETDTKLCDCIRVFIFLPMVDTYRQIIEQINEGGLVQWVRVLTA